MPAKEAPARFRNAACAVAAAEPKDAEIIQLRREAVAFLCSRVLKILAAVSEKAEAGSYLHARFLFEFLGILRGAAPKPPEPAQDSPLAAMLLKRLKIAAKSLKEAQTAEEAAAPAVADNCAVE